MGIFPPFPPLAKIGVLFSIATGAVIDIVIDVYRTHDVKLARNLYGFLNPRDVFLSDRACCSYADICFVKNQDCDAVIRLHQSRKQQLRKGKRIGDCDSLVTWSKPKSRPKGLSQEEFESLPDSLTVREVHYYICIPGWRTKEVTLITTLLDAELYPIKELLKIYELRWNVELNLRHIKTSLAMDILRGKTPEMVRKEIYVHLLAYNLLRTVMWQAGITHTLDSLCISLQESRHHFNHFVSELKDVSGKKRKKLFQIMLNLIAHKPLKKRVGRFEPRVKKRRPLILSIDARTQSYSQGKNSLRID
ncbi:MAG: IS4 family transposase [Xenococcaceae cyanobacterium]